MAGLRRRAGLGAAVACLSLALAAGPVAAQTPPATPPSPTAPDPLPQQGLQFPVETPQADSPSAASPSPPPGPSPEPLGAAQLPRDLAPWSMFASADVLVQAVIVSLAFASLVTWTVWLAKSLELLIARRRLRISLTRISQERSLSEAEAKVGSARGIVTSFIGAAEHELRLSHDVAERTGIKERVASRLARLEAAAARQMNKGTGSLATIGSTAPFVGLFGTVWGIMNSFIGISKAQTTNLALVAPGIAEALLATAFGLFAAIPAVIIYNQLVRSIGGYKGLMGDASAEVLRLVSRDLDRARVTEPQSARAAE